MLRLKFHVTLDNQGQSYNYDAEGRITAAFWGKTLLAIYEYNSEGNLVYENGSNGVQVFQRDAEGRPVWTYTPPGASGPVSTTEIYADDWLGGWQDGTLVFAGKDWLGTKRYESFGQGSSISSVTPIYFHSYTSLPFGDNLSSIGQDSMHFTGKERDAASGNDYFGARYYASTMGRFLSPDWSVKEEPVPYAKLIDPQTLNLYAYVMNNPLTGIDPDGHACTNFACQMHEDWNALHGLNNGAQQQNGSTKERIIEGVSGTANLGVAVGRGVGVVGEGIATPVTLGASAGLAAYESVQTVSQAGAGLTQIGGAISGKTTETNKAADAMIVSTSIAGVSVLAATKGNLDAASKAAAVEGLVSASATHSIFNSVGSMINTVMNIMTVVQAPPVAPPPGPGCSVAGAC